MKNTLKTIAIALVSSAATIGAYELGLKSTDPIVIEKVINKDDGSAANYQLAGNRASFGNVEFAEVAEKVTPGVVHIKSTIVQRAQSQRYNNPFHQFFGDDFFGNPHQRQPQEQKQQATGSGVIISEKGYIVTNNHVVSGADEIEVSLNDKRVFKAELVGTDPTTDLAVLKIKDEDLTTIPFGNSDELRVGEWVLAVGNPFNLESTVTAGIVSAKGRSINILKENFAIESFIQTDAAVNPGNSGGALVDVSGKLIGINTAIATPTGSYAGYSFAVPANITSKVVEDLIAYGKVQRALLGISIRNLDAALKGELNLDTKLNAGVYVDGVLAEGAAGKAGLEKGDIITEIEGFKITAIPELQEAIGRHRPGDKVGIKYWRAGKMKSVEATLLDKDGDIKLTKKGDESSSSSVAILGAKMKPLETEEKSKLGLRYGIKVEKILDGVIRRQTDIREGFIITKINHQPVQNLDEVNKVLDNERGGVLIEGVYPNSKGVFYYGLGIR